MRLIYILILGAIAIQSTQLIKLKEYYCGYGVIFGEQYKYPFVNSGYKTSFTPSVKQLENAERVLLSNYYDYKIKVLDSFKSKYKISHKLKDSTKVKKRFFKYYRQYAGYVSTSNDSIIYIGLFNFTNSKRASVYFEGWDRTLFLGSGEFYDRNQEFYLINLSRKSIMFK
jgi:hypothetical protein